MNYDKELKLKRVFEKRYSFQCMFVNLNSNEVIGICTNSKRLFVAKFNQNKLFNKHFILHEHVSNYLDKWLKEVHYVSTD